MLVCKNVFLNEKRTSLRLEEEMWWTLKNICKKENITIFQLCTKINDIRGEAPLAHAMRAFALAYNKSTLCEYEQKLVISPGKQSQHSLFKKLFKQIR